jgi:hypothetical protein
MTLWSKRKISIDADYEPPSVNRWTPEDDLAQKLYAPPPIDDQHKVDMPLADLCIVVFLLSLIPAVLFVSTYILLPY